MGPTEWATYIAGAACTLAAVVLLWHLLVAVRGVRYASVAALAVLCVTYYSGGLRRYNHDVVLMLVGTACMSVCWKAWRTRRLGWWATLGLCLGAGSLTKYQIAVTAASVAVFWIHQRGWRDSAQRRGLLLAALIALLVFAPHLSWLRSHEFAPIDYALQSSLATDLGASSRFLDSARWLADQLANRALPAAVLLSIAAFAARRETGGANRAQAPSMTPHRGASRALLLSWGLVPLAFMPMLSLIAGTALPLHWGAPFLLFVVPATMELPRCTPWTSAPPNVVVLAFVAIQALLLAINYVTSCRGPHMTQSRDWRNFDTAELARSLEQPVREALGGPICVVTGPAYVAGAVALFLSDHPLVLIEGRYDRSPWISPDLVERCGALELVQQEASTSAGTARTTVPGLSWRSHPPRRARPPVAGPTIE